MDDCDYLVNFDYHREQKPNYDVESTTVGPGEPAHITINSIMVRPHSYSHWLPTDINKWKQDHKAFEFLKSECLEYALDY
jgi:hypothetical protein